MNVTPGCPVKLLVSAASSAVAEPKTCCSLNPKLIETTLTFGLLVAALIASSMSDRLFDAAS